MPAPLLDLSRAKPRGWRPILDSNFAGTYIGIRGFIRKGDKKGRWALKVGQGCGKGGVVGRCDNQGLSIAFGMPAKMIDHTLYFLSDKNHENPVYGIRSLESVLMDEMKERFNNAPVAHEFAGYTETFGDFKTPEKAYMAARDMLKNKLDDLTMAHGEPIPLKDFWAECST